MAHATTFTAAGDHYWRYVPAGRYRIGGWEDGEASADQAAATCSIWWPMGR